MCCTNNSPRHKLNPKKCPTHPCHISSSQGLVDWLQVYIATHGWIILPLSTRWWRIRSEAPRDSYLLDSQLLEWPSNPTTIDCQNIAIRCVDNTLTKPKREENLKLQWKLGTKTGWETDLCNLKIPTSMCQLRTIVLTNGWSQNSGTSTKVLEAYTSFIVMTNCDPEMMPCYDRVPWGRGQSGWVDQGFPQNGSEVTHVDHTNASQ